jgi:hypothetical protein
MRDYVLFHDKRHPQEMGVPEVRAFLEDGRFSRQTGKRVEAAAAIRFLYEVVLQRHWPREACRSIRPGDRKGIRELDQTKDTQRQALNALVFLYRTVLDRELGKVMPVRGRHGKRLPVVLTRREVPGVLQRIQGGCGMHN